MNGHLEALIERYIDGELRPEQARAAEAHLAGCPTCRASLARQQALRALLVQAPAAEGLKPEGRFTAEVGLRMARREPASALPAPTAVLWHLVPIGLVLALAFIEAVVVVSTLLSLIPGAGQTLQNLGTAALLPDLAAFLPAPLQDLTAVFGGLSYSLWNPITGLAVLVAAGWIALGWLASWYAKNRPAASGRD